MASSQKTAALYFTEHQVAELLFSRHLSFTDSRFREFSEEQQLLAIAKTLNTHQRYGDITYKETNYIMRTTYTLASCNLHT